MPGPLKVMLTIRSRTGGQGRIQWKLTGQSDFPTAGQSVEYRIEPGDDWQTVQLDLPVEGVPAVFRIYLPAEQSPTEMQMIRFSAGSKVRQWRFH